MKKAAKTLILCSAAALLLCGSALAKQFTDVPADAWYAEAVQFVSRHGLMNGTASDTFSPDRVLTRAQFVAVMYRMNGSPAVSEEEYQSLSVLHDIPESAWYRDSAAWAVSHGILAGYADQTFRPGTPLTHAQLLLLLCRAAGDPTIENETKEPFQDEPLTSSIFARSVVWAREMEIAVRDESNLLEPYAPTTRAYAAATLYAFLKAYPDQLAGGTASESETDGGTASESETDSKTDGGTDGGSQDDLKPYSPYLISEAVYPSVPAVYPVREDYRDERGGMDSAAYDRYHQALDEYNALHKLDKEYTDGLEPFYAAAISQFLDGDGKENKVCSPLNIYMALGMLSEACDGNSRSQILKLMNAEDLDEVQTRANAIWRAQYYHDNATQCVLSNSIWTNSQFAKVLNLDTLDSIANDFYASTFQGEAGTEEYNRALQAWLNEQTEGLLEKQASQLTMDRFTVLALVSTISFHDEWTDKFRKDNTEPGTFRAKSGKETCDFMHETGSRYYVGKQFTAVPKPFQRTGSMWFILPKAGVSPEKLLQDQEALQFLTSDKSKWWYETKATYLRIHESIPKFDVSSETDLISGLKKLGVTDIFDDMASDFSPLTELIPLVVSKAEHDARVTIDEDGCTAVAYTAVFGRAMSSMNPTYEDIDFILDRPFLFVITGVNETPLFVGIVNNPNKK